MTTITLDHYANLVPKRQVFVDNIVRNGGNGSQAYRDSGYEVANDNVASTEAHRLLRNPNVVAAIVERKAAVINEDKRQEAVTHDWMVAEYLDTYRDARNVGDLTAARMTLDSLGKLTGLMVNRTELTDKRNPVRDQLAGMTLDAVMALMARWENELDALPVGDVIEGDVIGDDVMG
jgi:phage terminase small subunit